MYTEILEFLFKRNKLYIYLIKCFWILLCNNKIYVKENAEHQKWLSNKAFKMMFYLALYRNRKVKISKTYYAPQIDNETLW